MQDKPKCAALRCEAVTAAESERARSGMWALLLLFFVFFIGGVDDGWENL